MPLFKSTQRKCESRIPGDLNVDRKNLFGPGEMRLSQPQAMHYGFNINKCMMILLRRNRAPEFSLYVTPDKKSVRRFKRKIGNDKFLSDRPEPCIF